MPTPNYASKTTKTEMAASSTKATNDDDRAKV